MEERLSALFATNKKGRNVRVAFDDEGKPLSLDRTDQSGHFAKEISIPETRIAKADPDGFATYSVSSCDDEQAASGSIQLLEPNGLSVVSTIDDTIKQTGTSDRVAAAANTLLRPYRPVEGMPRLYQAWKLRGADFHYVSGMPRELFGSFARFMTENGYPRGSIHLRPWGAGGGSALDKIDHLVEMFSDEGFKREQISSLIAGFPQREFVLVGNSIANDPEVFGDIARQYPDRVRAVYILDQSPASKPERFRSAFRGLAPGKWRLFRKADDVASAI